MQGHSDNGSLTRLATTNLAIVSVVWAFVSGPADAATLTNRDAKPHQIEVLFKSARRAHELLPGKTLAGFCAEGCIVRLNGSVDHDFELEGSERVSIEGGLVYYDGEEIKPKSDVQDPQPASDPN